MASNAAVIGPRSRRLAKIGGLDQRVEQSGSGDAQMQRLATMFGTETTRWPSDLRQAALAEVSGNGS
jgi:hypothetical protein